MLIDFKLFAILPIFHLIFQTGLAWDPKEERKEFQNVCLNFHNILRLLHGAPPLKWEDNLYESAQAWANHLNAIQKIEHPKEAKFGSNIYANSNPKDIDLMCLYAVVYWFKERKKYDFNKPGYAEETGHFTQMVWKDSEFIGIGESGQADGNFYLVAEYHYQGNYPGEFEKNVLPIRKISSACVREVSSTENSKLIIKELNMDSKELSEFFYEDDTPCVLPTRDPRPGTSGTTGDTATPQKGTTGTKGGTKATQGGTAESGDTATPQKGTTGTKGGTKATQGGTAESGPQTTYAATPEKIMLVPVNEPAAGVQTTPEIILAPAQPAPQTTPEIIIAPATNLPAPTQPLPVAPEGNGAKARTPNVQTTSISASVSLNTTVYPSSSLVSPTATKSISVSSFEGRGQLTL